MHIKIKKNWEVRVRREYRIEREIGARPAKRKRRKRGQKTEVEYERTEHQYRTGGDQRKGFFFKTHEQSEWDLNGKDQEFTHNVSQKIGKQT